MSDADPEQVFFKLKELGADLNHTTSEIKQLTFKLQVAKEKMERLIREINTTNQSLSELTGVPFQPIELPQERQRQ